MNFNIFYPNPKGITVPSLQGTHNHFLLHKARMMCFLYYTSVCFLSGLKFRVRPGQKKIQEKDHLLSLPSLNYLFSPSPHFIPILFPRLPGTQPSSSFPYPLLEVSHLRGWDLLLWPRPMHLYIYTFMR